MTGYLLVITKPVAGDIYVNSEYRGSGYLHIILDAGTYYLAFGDFNNYITPQPMTVEIFENKTTSIEITYTEG